MRSSLAQWFGFKGIVETHRQHYWLAVATCGDETHTSVVHLDTDFIPNSELKAVYKRSASNLGNPLESDIRLNLSYLGYMTAEEFGA